MFRVLFPSNNCILCTSAPPCKLLRPLSHNARPHPHDLQLRASPSASPLLAEGARQRSAKCGVRVADFGRSQVFFHSTFRGRPACRTPLRSPCLRHGGGLEADSPAILRTDLANILAEIVAAGGGKAGVGGRHKDGHKAETTAATAPPTAISATSMKPRTMADRRKR